MAKGSIFTKKSSLVLSWLIGHSQDQGFSINGIAQALEVSPQTVHKVISALVDKGLIEARGQSTGQSYSLKSAPELLQYWTDHYNIYEKCKLHHYAECPLSFSEVVQRLSKHKLQNQIVWGLHSAMRKMGRQFINQNTLEFYILDQDLIPVFEEVLELIPDPSSNHCLLIEPYYKEWLQRGLHSGQWNTSSALMTYLDLYHYQFRGEEAAEALLSSVISQTEKSLNVGETHHLFKVLDRAVEAVPELRREGVIVGGVALMLYSQLAQSEVDTVMTTDVDISLQRHVKGFQGAVSQLEKAGFKHKFKGLHTPSTEAFELQVEDQLYELEFLTDAKSRAKSHANVKIGGLVAQPLRFLELSQKHTLEVTLPSRSVVQVVAPEVWIFHKGLTFTQRKAQSSKYYKDLYGLWFVATQYGEFSENALIKLEGLFKDYPSWAQRFRKNLKTFNTMASPGDWKKLQQQDPAHQLTKNNFNKLLYKWL